MYLKHFYKLFILLLFAVLFQSRSAGPAEVANLQVSGAPGSTGDMGTCANSGCHVDGALNASLEVSFTTTSSEAVTEYQPGTEYFVDLMISADQTFAGSGFQIIAMDENEESIGTWNSLPGAAQTSELNGRTYAEHNQNLTNGPTLWQLNWTAPVEGSGAVTFYAAALANNNNGNTAGDGVATTNFTISEFGVSSTNNANQDLTSMLISPNLIVDQVNVSVFSKRSGDFDLNIITTSGQLVYAENINLQVGENQKSLDLGQLGQGLYFLQIRGENQVMTQRVIKL